MAETTTISWCDHTFNPWIGCTKVAPGCTNCYAEGYAKRFNKAAWGSQGTRVKTSDAYWRKALKWDRDAERDGVRRRVFCASLADVFEDWKGPIVDSDGNFLSHCGSVFMPEPVMDPEGWKRATMQDVRRDLFRLIDRTPHLNWLFLTKRPENVRRMWLDAMDPDCSGHINNIWMGCSVSDQSTADRNVPLLLECRDLCPVLFLSCEPLLDVVDLWGSRYPLPDGGRGSAFNWGKGLSWVIVGGESGPNHRPMDIEWARDLRDQCRAADVPYFFKQVSGLRSGMGVDALGEVVQEFPESRRDQPEVS